MSANGNWRFWVDDNGMVRTFDVVASDEIRACEIVQRALPDATTFSHREVSIMRQIPRGNVVNGFPQVVPMSLSAARECVAQDLTEGAAI